MAEQSMLQIFERDGITNVEFAESNILDEISIRRIGDELQNVIDRKGVPKIVLNFQNVTALSSSALGMLITVNTKVGEKHGKLAMSCIKEPIREVFRITKLDKAFAIFDTVGQALTSVR
ncbi:MAG: STAS domain-containing protein [Phycisphaerales bacterium]|jgi:anti-anti-sigma factor|nr:STAS domain-containing protein [Phycisphaerales bacterium]MDP6693214.1 STAS domain-containing protein [Phycisphaerales bacterium]